MIKIIRQGNKKKKIECENCEAILQYEPEDIRETKAKVSWKRFIICPQCNNEIIIESSR